MSMNFDIICRLCMAKSNNLVPIFDEKGILSARIMCLAPVVKLCNGDGLPTKVCKPCILQVNISFKFRLQCENSDATLRRYLDGVKSCKGTENHLTSLRLTSVKEEISESLQELSSNDYNYEDQHESSCLSGEKETLEHRKIDKLKGIPDGSKSTYKSRTKGDELLDDVKQLNANIICETASLSDINISCTGTIKAENILNNSPSQVLGCNMCNKLFSCRSKLVEHSSKHTGVKPYSCKLCNKKFTRQSSLNIHMLSHTGQKPYRCEICCKKFSQLSSLKTHSLTHTGQKPRVCEICGRRFARLDNLKSHVQIHTEHKSYVCEACGKMFKKLALLKAHSIIHTERKPFFCDICGKSFVNIYSFRTHAAVHTSEKPYSCEDCKKSFTLKNSLKIHIQTHTGLKPHECGVCGKKFSQSHSLKTHTVVHTGQKPFSCQMCGKCFKQRHTLKKHMESHTL